jgi:hypothetical protein
MVEKSADIQTIAPRVAWLEEAIKWLLDNRGEAGADPSTLLQKLYLSSIWGSQAGSQSADVWNHDTTYTSATGDKSLHITIFGLGDGNAVACQVDSKGLFNWIFASGDTRWSSAGGAADMHLASDVFGSSGATDDFLAELRGNSLSLAKAVFGDPTTIGATRPDSVMGRVENLQQQLDDLADNAESAVGDLQTQLDAATARIDAIVVRLANAHIP